MSKSLLFAENWDVEKFKLCRFTPIKFSRNYNQNCNNLVNVILLNDFYTRLLNILKNP